MPLGQVDRKLCNPVINRFHTTTKAFASKCSESSTLLSDLSPAEAAEQGYVPGALYDFSISENRATDAWATNARREIRRVAQLLSVADGKHCIVMSYKRSKPYYVTTAIRRKARACGLLQADHPPTPEMMLAFREFLDRQ